MQVYFGVSLTIVNSIAISPVISHILSDGTVRLNSYVESISRILINFGDSILVGASFDYYCNVRIVS